MSDLISRQVAIDYVDCGHLRPPTEIAWSDLDVVNMLKKLPSAEQKTKCIAQIRIDRDDVEDFINEKVNEIVKKMAEPKIGRWLWSIEGYFYCSRCGKKPNDQTRTTDFCPNCGADMRGGDYE